MERLSLAKWPLPVQLHEHTTYPSCAHMKMHKISAPYHFHSPHSWKDFQVYRQGRLGGYAQAVRRGATHRALLERMGGKGRTALPVELQLQIFNDIFEDWVYEIERPEYEEMEDTIRRLFAGYSNAALDEVAVTALCETVRHQELDHQDWVENGLHVEGIQNWQREPSMVRYLEIRAILTLVEYYWDSGHPTIDERSRRPRKFLNKYSSLRTVTVNLSSSTEDQLARRLMELSSQVDMKILADFLDGLVVLKSERKINVVIRACVPSQRRGVILETLLSTNLDVSFTGKELCGVFAEVIDDMVTHTEEYNDS